MYIKMYGADVVEWSRALDIRAKRLVLQCINGVSSNPVEGRTKNWFNFQTDIYIQMYIYILKLRVMQNLNDTTISMICSFMVCKYTSITTSFICIRIIRIRGITGRIGNL